MPDCKIYNKFLEKKKQFAVLIDPDKHSENSIRQTAKLVKKHGVDFIFYGGSLMTTSNFVHWLIILKEFTSAPVILFPGSSLQLSEKADGILLLSLISGRNPEMLIGKHVTAAPFLKSSGLEILPTGYILIDGGRQTTVSYISNTTPIPSDKDEIAGCTALAGEMLGLKLIYLDAGSGASKHVPTGMISKVKAEISVPLIVGGGIKSAQQAKDICLAGADVVVVGNAIEKSITLISKISETLRKINS
jgi:putative glycerol-1-phosphate prenyltransferase